MKKSRIIILTITTIVILSFIAVAIGMNNSTQPELSKVNEDLVVKKGSKEVTIERQDVNAVPVEAYLEFFTNEFPLKVHLTREPEGMPSLVLNGEALSDKYILMKNGTLIPPINGHAYSYKRLSNEIVWLITYKVGRYGGATDIFLNIINENLDSLGSTFLLSNSFGEDGYFSYQNGEFINDSTYKYKRVWNDEDYKKDSLSGIHIIR